MNYIETTFIFTPYSEDATDLLSAFLADIGYESFVAEANGSKAYIAEKQYDAAKVTELLINFPMEGVDITFESNLIEGEDWNSEWEKNYFQPIVIDTRCVIHSSFHTNLPQVKHKILIDPKMAFGTGHHDTTHLMLQEMLELDVKGKSLLDMGCGTAVLAILAAQRGAAPILAIDIDECAYTNAIENCTLNHTTQIEVALGGAELLDGKHFDVVFANINRNILLADMPAYAAVMPQGGEIFMSGFYTQDIEILKAKAAELGLIYKGFREQNNWVAIHFSK